MVKVLVCGGRDYTAEKVAFQFLDDLHARHNFTCVVHGDARGADTLAKRWAQQEGITLRPYPADWATHGKRAGHIRNAEMLAKERPRFVVAFPGGKGTEHMVAIAMKANWPLQVLSFVEEEVPVMSARKKFLRLLPVAAVAATTGVDSESFMQLREIIGGNQNVNTPNHDGSFTAAQWTAARDALTSVERIRDCMLTVRSVKAS